VKPAVEHEGEPGARRAAVCSFTATFSGLHALVAAMGGFGELAEAAGAGGQPAEEAEAAEGVTRAFEWMGQMGQELHRREVELVNVDGAWRLPMWYEPGERSWHLPCGFRYPGDQALREAQEAETPMEWRECPHCDERIEADDVDGYRFCPYCGGELGEDEGEGEMRDEEL
jgi:hypothetical protein